MHKFGASKHAAMPRHPQVNFYLKYKKTANNKAVKSAKKQSRQANTPCLIYLQFKYEGNKLFYSFGQLIEPGRWNEKKQRAIDTNTLSSAHIKDGERSAEFQLNSILEALANECDRYYKVCKGAKTVPAPAVFREHLDRFLNPDTEKSKASLYNLIQRFIDGEIKNRGKEKSTGIKKAYQVTLTHLKGFEKATGHRVDFDTIDLSFYYKFVGYLESIGNVPNTIGGRIKNLKTFMAEAVDLGLTTNMAFKNKKFTKPENDTDGVYLTDDELMRLHRLDLTENKRLQHVRDLFLIGCFTGLRFSDYNNIKPENIVRDGEDDFIKIITQKTGALAMIPCNPVILEILKRYGHTAGKLPKSISNQNFNEYVKEVCQAAALAETGRLSTDMAKPLFECVSSHTARRSFATNLYLENYPTIEIMKITGHKTEKAFLKYIKVSKLDAARRLSAHIKKNWSQKILRVAV